MFRADQNQNKQACRPGTCPPWYLFTVVRITSSVTVSLLTVCWTGVVLRPLLVTSSEDKLHSAQETNPH